MLLFTLLQGCSLIESAEDKQVKACVEDIKLGLNDPTSIEVLSKEFLPSDDKTRRLKLEFTAKNAVGGRVRSVAVCGFKEASATTLDPDDFQNQMREMERNLNATGIRLR